jgi:hypothetical protein
MCTIPLTKGYSTVVDDEDYEGIIKHRWFANVNSKWVSARRFEYNQGKRIGIYLHRQIVNAKPGEYVDHINGDKLDNRKCNLRICTNAQNTYNQRAKSNNKSGYKGVSWNKWAKKWYAAIRADGKTYSLGYFKDKELAAIAYNEAATKLHRDFARLNKIGGDSKWLTGKLY